MAPPPPANKPMGERLLAVAQTLQFAWFCGHLTLLLCVMRYSLSYVFLRSYSRWAQFSYRTAFLSAAATYGIVVFKAYRARMKSGRAQGGLGGVLQLAADENVQYLIMALIWLLSRQIPLALLPFAVYSVFHVLTYVRSTLLPILQPPPQPASPSQKPPQSGLSETIGKFVKGYYDTSMTLVAILEILLVFRILGSVLILQKGAFVLLLEYAVFLRARFAQSTFVQQVFTQIGNRIDVYAADQRTPPVARQVWEQAKGGLQKVVEMTDLRRYAQGAQQQSAPKKAQ
ncbi:MAG: hypothetical protein M1821_008200 [Bathelium mastoideum]|nr:MAG: hypothetical protein M1821_008200 [Bathelium mastoideum]KAI9693244.1 MAG: hypothetical protein M1822_005240 [Bathelium mastoideum]